MSKHEYRPPSSVGVNVHPCKIADHLTTDIACAIVGMRGLAESAGDEEWNEIADAITPHLRRANRKMQKLYEHLRTLQMISPETFRKARDGDIPWPGVQQAEGWVPPCRCWNPCAICDGVPEQDEEGNRILVKRERTEDELWEHTCTEWCHQHDAPSGSRWREQREGGS